MSEVSGLFSCLPVYKVWPSGFKTQGERPKEWVIWRLNIRLGELDSQPCHTHRHPVKINKSYSLGLTTTNDASAQALYLAHKDLKALALSASLTFPPSLLPSVPALLFPLSLCLPPWLQPLILQPFKSIYNPSKGWHLCSCCLFPFPRRQKTKTCSSQKK